MGARENPGINILIVTGRGSPASVEDYFPWEQKKKEIRHWLVAWRTFFREDAPMYRNAAETCERLLQLDPPTRRCRAGRVLLSLGEALIQRATSHQAQPLPPVTRESVAGYLAGECLYWEQAQQAGDLTAGYRQAVLRQMERTFFGEPD